MRRAIIKLAVMLAVAAPLVVSQTVPAPAPAPKPAKPPVRRSVGQAYVFAGPSTGSYLGIDPRDITADRVGPLKLKSERGVEVAMVDQDSPAGKAGLKEHDVILTFNSQNVESVEELKRMLRETPPGRTVALGISRDGNPMTLNVQLGDRSKMMPGMGAFRIPDVRIPPMPELPDVPMFMTLTMVGRSGVMVEGLTAQLGDYFGVKNGEGVLVRSVEKGTPGEASGLKAGDVIIGAGSERIADTGDWRRVIGSHVGETLQLRVIRDKREITVPLAIPKRRTTGALVPSEDWEIELRGLENELQRLRPEMEKIRSVEIAQLQREMQLHQKDIQLAQERARAEVEQYRRTHQREMEKMRRELEKAQKELQRELQQRLERY